MPTKIEYTDHTWNPITGCSKDLVSSGCDNCYAKRIVEQRLSSHTNSHYRKVRFQPCILEDAIKKPRVPKSGTVFIGDMGDMIGLREFYEEGVIITTDGSIEPLSIEVVDSAVNDVLRFVRSRPSQQFLILTKRSKSLSAYDLAIQNLWVGVTICNQDEVWKLEDLVNSNAINKWLSIEPMIGEVRFNPKYLSQVQWVVCGGERTKKADARPLHQLSVKLLSGACKKEGVAFFFKQEGSVSYLMPDFVSHLSKELPVALQGTQTGQLADIILPEKQLGLLV